MRGDAAPLRHLPREWMYRAPLPRTKLESPLPTRDLRRHARRPAAARRRASTAGPGWSATTGAPSTPATWIWLHGVAFDDAPDAWLDLVGRARAHRPAS